MITIITGPINSGKTRRLNEIYLNNGKGDGFVCEKFFIREKFSGYNLRRLSTNQTRDFIFLTIPQLKLKSSWHFGKFTFDREVFQWAELVYIALINNSTEPLYLDEIGPLELENKGFCRIFNKILSSQLDLFFTTRISLLGEVVAKFKLGNFKLIRIQQ